MAGPFTSRWIGFVDLQAKPSRPGRRGGLQLEALSFLMAWPASEPLPRRAASTSPKSRGDRNPKEGPIFQWLSTIIGNVKTGPNGTYQAFNFKT